MHEYKECIKCKQTLTIDNFSTFIAVTKFGKIKKIRNVCYECNYKKCVYKTFHWKQSTDKQKLQRLKERFQKFVIKQRGCWGWKGFIRPDGYTRMKFLERTKEIGGHVASWMITNKKLDTNGLYVLHTCDNRSCTNPRHLFLGTSRDNMIDMLNKQRHPNTKLTIQQVKEIKKLLKTDITVTAISKMYSVNFRTIADIRDNETWKHVTVGESND